MNNLIKLFSILQLTKEMPLTGYLAAGVKLSETASLAEHHYTASLMSIFLCDRIIKAGGQIKSERVLKMVMVHDLSELFGGDISAPLNRKYPDLKEYKDKIGWRAVEMLSDYLNDAEKDDFKNLFIELDKNADDESVVAKIMDQIDHQLFMEHHNVKLKYDAGAQDYRPKFILKHIIALTEKIKDPITKRVMDEFLAEFQANFYNKGFQPVSLLTD
ncbi:MAG: hypothetical protein COU31_01935 [Candidatus Magasanikbacteria bacterium CG10_big_fil_rev_8_21_14_0_10_40_10]|uniref:HD domain-containing protein n=1 Tax=Candidatus Magasanikbacteria bacterium CG10_big_fil_rev_8_21_14_0_10_40_10 TaxID=1974648 RepID=A0A2M6W480_9BACT|nr:MAG: hypothetical protein COU31_01935 [Candidatus Magasanikbacteria bacterium CG10_big_fil_rev_8_21_14_0_10_40_10]